MFVEITSEINVKILEGVPIVGGPKDLKLFIYLRDK